MLNSYKFLVCNKCDHHISHTFNFPKRTESNDFGCSNSWCDGEYETIIEDVKPCPRCGENASFGDAVSSRYVSCSCGISMTEHRYSPNDGRSLIHKWNERPSKDGMSDVLAMILRDKYGVSNGAEYNALIDRMTK